MTRIPPQAVCWSPVWSPGHEGNGLEVVNLSGHAADSVLLAIGEDGVPFRMRYQLRWDEHGRLRQADLLTDEGGRTMALALRADGAGLWHDGQGQPLPELNGCIDIDIWPTPLTNSFPLWRTPLLEGEHADFLMAWVHAPALTVEAKAQAYTRLGERRYRFDSLDGSGFSAELALDEHGLVADYPGLFKRVALPKK